MTHPSRPISPPEFDLYLQIALDENSERNLRLAAEALMSAILNGATDIRSEAVEILNRENEPLAAASVARILNGNYSDN